MAPGTLVHIVSFKPKLSYRIKAIGPQMIIRILKISPVMLNESENVCLIWQTGLLFIVIKSYHQCETVMSPFECDTIYLSRCIPYSSFGLVLSHIWTRDIMYIWKKEISLFESESMKSSIRLDIFYSRLSLTICVVLQFNAITIAF